MLIQRAAAPEKIEKYAKFQVSQFTHYEKQRLKDKYPHLARDPEAFLFSRLVQANLRRRQIFLYILSHHNKISTPDMQASRSVLPEPIQQQVIRPVISTRIIDVPQSVTFSDTFLQPSELPRMRSPHSETTATLFIDPNKTGHLRSGLQALLEASPQLSSEFSDSEISSAASHSSHEALSRDSCIPPLPKSSDSSAGKKAYSECPYCFKSIRISSEHKWG